MLLFPFVLTLVYTSDEKKDINIVELLNFDRI